MSATPGPGGAAAEVLPGLPTGGAQLAALYAELWDAGVDPVTLELCRLRIATLIGSTADLAVRA